jgi:hypothetical protein
MRQVVSAQEMAYGDVGDVYVTAGTQNGTPQISTYLGPLSDAQTAANYRWLINTGCSPAGQFFCAYARLETAGARPTEQNECLSRGGSQVVP